MFIIERKPQTNIIDREKRSILIFNIIYIFGEKMLICELKKRKLFFLKLTFPKNFLYICMLHKAKLKCSNESIVVHYNNYQLSKAKLIIMAIKSNTYIKVLKKSSLIEVICCHLKTSFKIMVVIMIKSSYCYYLSVDYKAHYESHSIM